MLIWRKAHPKLLDVSLVYWLPDLHVSFRYRDGIRLILTGAGHTLLRMGDAPRVSHLLPNPAQNPRPISQDVINNESDGTFSPGQHRAEDYHHSPPPRATRRNNQQVWQESSQYSPEEEEDEDYAESDEEARHQARKRKGRKHHVCQPTIPR